MSKERDDAQNLLDSTGCYLKEIDEAKEPFFRNRQFERLLSVLGDLTQHVSEWQAKLNNTTKEG